MKNCALLFLSGLFLVFLGLSAIFVWRIVINFLVGLS